MDPILLSCIHRVEHKYGSVAAPNADLSSIRERVRELGLDDDKQKRGPKNHYYHKMSDSNRWYTWRKDVHHAMIMIGKLHCTNRQAFLSTDLNRQAISNIGKLTRRNALIYIPKSKKKQIS